MNTIPAGYKQTEVGVIPNEWGVISLIDCCDFADYRGKTPPKTSSGTFLVTARNVRKGYIDYSESQEYVPTELYDEIMRRGKPRIGDVLITTEAPLGVASRTIIWSLVKQMRVCLIPLFHGLHRRTALES